MAKFSTKATNFKKKQKKSIQIKILYANADVIQLNAQP